MIEPETLDALLKSGASPKVIVRFVKEKQRAAAERRAERRERDRIRKRQARELKKQVKSDAASDGQTRTGADEKEGFPQTPSQENNYPSPPKGGPSQTPRGILEAVLDAQRAQAVLEHRRALRKPLTAHGAKLLAEKFNRCPDPNAAADAMVANGWLGFEPEWLENRVRPVARAAAPPKRREPRNVSELALQLLEEMDENSNVASNQTGYFSEADEEGVLAITGPT